MLAPRALLSFGCLGALQLLLIAYPRSVLSARNYDIRFLSIDCKTIDHTLLSDVKCEITRTATKPPITALSANFTMNRPSNDVYVQVLVDVTNAMAQRQFSLINANVSVCEFLNAKTTGNIYTIVHNSLQKYINAWPSCPFAKGQLIAIRDFQFDVNDFPSYVPEAQVNTQLTFSEFGKPTGYFRCSVEVTYKRTVFQPLLKT